jgi:hypothetical protein
MHTYPIIACLSIPLFNTHIYLVIQCRTALEWDLEPVVPRRLTIEWYVNLLYLFIECN